jgi:phytoene dehydrogenase-like protein
MSSFLLERRMKKIAIIGAGLGGLTAGNLLARKGHRVTLFEAHGTPGGYTAGFRRKGLYFESGTVSFESSAQVFKMMKDLGVYDKVTFVRQVPRMIGRNFDAVVESYADFKTTFRDAFPGERSRLDGYFAEVDKLYRAMEPMSRTKPPNAWQMARSLVRIALLYRKYRNETITDFTARHFGRESELFRLFKNLGYPDMSAYILGGAVATIVLDYWTVKEGMQAWADALAEAFKARGGELLVRSPVDKIVTKNGAAAGVESGGRFHEADVVVSASDYKKTFLKLLDDPALVPPALRDKIAAAQVSEGICTVYCGLNLPSETLGERLKKPHVFFMDEQPRADLRDPSDPDFFAKSAFSMFSPSALNPVQAPAGKSSLMIQSVAPYRWMNDWGGGDKEAYKALKEKVRAALITRASAVLPDLESLLEFSEAATPKTYERYTANSEGATSAWSWNPGKKFYRGLFKSYVKTPVRNLYIGSCWATQIGGIPGALNAARKCSKVIG